jgi:hypothetical protein
MKITGKHIHAAEIWINEVPLLEWPPTLRQSAVAYGGVDDPDKMIEVVSAWLSSDEDQYLNTSQINRMQKAYQKRLKREAELATEVVEEEELFYVDDEGICPNCDTVNVGENSKCTSCGTQLISKDLKKFIKRGVK